VLPTRVRHDGGAFGDEQAFLRRGREHATALALLHDGLVVLLRLETEHAEAKAALTGDRLRMASTRIAAGLRQNRLNVPHEAQRLRGETSRGDADKEKGVPKHDANLRVQSAVFGRGMRGMEWPPKNARNAKEGETTEGTEYTEYTERIGGRSLGEKRVEVPTVAHF